MHGRRCGTKSENALYCYECTTYRKSKGCYFHGVPEKYLETEVLQAIQRVIYKANANPDEFYKAIQKRVEKRSDDCKAVVLAELENLSFALRKSISTFKVCLRQRSEVK